MCVGYSVQGTPSPLFIRGRIGHNSQNVSLSTKVKLYTLFVRYVRGYISANGGSGKNRLHSAKIKLFYFSSKSPIFQALFVCYVSTPNIKNNLHFPPKTQKNSLHPNFSLFSGYFGLSTFVKNSSNFTYHFRLSPRAYIILIS